MEKQYNVGIYYDNKNGELYNNFHRLLVDIMPTDRSGNQKRWVLSREDLPYIGEILVLKTLDKETAEMAHREIGKLEGIIIFEPTECEWEKPVRKTV